MASLRPHSSIFFATLLVLNYSFLAAAQYFQNFNPTLIPDPRAPGRFYSGYEYRPVPDIRSSYRKVIDLGRSEQVNLYYNCYYMTNICQNVQDFKATPRGQNLHPGTNIAADVFTYDFDTGQHSWTHQYGRREKSCPGSWSGSHPCPEGGQRTVWRHDGPWWTTALEPSLNDNTLMHRRDAQGNVIEHSRVKYSCDEFPPATWVEGGNGWNNQQPANTFCAGISCVDRTPQNNNNGAPPTTGVKIKAEQNWQATAHVHLRNTLLAVIEGRRNEFPWFNATDPKWDVAFFKFSALNMGPDGVAATVFLSDATTGVDHDHKYITQARRRAFERGEREEGDEGTTTAAPEAEELTKTPRRLSGPSAEEAYQQMLAGRGRRYDVYAHMNESFMASPGLGGLAGTGMQVADLADLEVRAGSGHMPSRSESPGPAQGGRKSRALPGHDHAKPLLKAASSDDLVRARAIVADAIAASAKLNKARMAKPARNQYRLKPGTVVGKTTVAKRRHRVRGAGSISDRDAADESSGPAAPPPPPLLEITEEIAWAAALVAEAEAVATEGGAQKAADVDAAADGPGPGLNVTRRLIADPGPRLNTTLRASARGSYWMESIARKGTVPWGNDPSYAVFRNVLDYGAVGNGVTDDTAAIKKAMNNGRRCGEKCNGSTVKNAIVYFPPGTYLISSTVPLPFGTQVIGDAIDRPVLVVSSSFVGLGMLSTSEYTGGGVGTDGRDQQWFVNTANFYRQIRNVILDVRPAPRSETTACLHYQIAQATSMQNVELRAGPGQKGMYAENGSGGQISDVTFKGGDIGLYGGNQQFTAQRLVFDGCSVGVQVIWDWGWVWKSVTMSNVGVGFKFVSDDDSGSIGSSSIMDSSFTNVGTVVVITPPSEKPGSSSTGIVLDNVAMSGVATAVADTNGRSLLAPSARIAQWVLGPVYSGSTDAGSRSWSSGGKVGNYRRQVGLLDGKGAFFERPKPQYEGQGVGDFVHVKDFGATGDGSTDDTDAFQQAIYASQGKILFVDAGSYILTRTVTVPTGIKMVGETWSQLVAAGPAFSDETKPTSMLQVGVPGQVGNVEMQDLMFTTKGPTAGAVLLEWNMAADAMGSAAIWDCHVRIGGATGTELTPDECPALSSGIAPGCNAASLMMHIKPGSSGYFENMWLWVADHMIDDPDLEDANNTMVQNSVYVARGLLIESTEPTWLYGTSSEHAVYYQYNFHNAENIFAGMIQTESPYYQPTPNPPAPFANVVGRFPGDPDYTCAAGDEFNGCDESWAVIMRGCEDIFVAGAGLYSWFSTYTQECIDGQLCQKVLMLLEGNHASVRIQHLITIGAKYMAVMEGKGLPAQDNLNVDSHPFWSQVSLIDVASDGAQFNDVIWLKPAIWDMDQPEFSCVPPCRVKIPPYTGATTTVDFPLMTVSKDAWTSTITVPPLTLSKLGFEVVTLVDGARAGTPGKRLNRRAFEDFWPVPATTSAWPVVVYHGPDGQKSTASPTKAFPTPPASIGPGAAAPAKGAWPTAALRPRAVLVDPNQEIEDMTHDWLCEQWASSPSYYDDYRRECPNWREPDWMGEIPLGPGGIWDVPRITSNGTGSIPGFDASEDAYEDELVLCGVPDEPTSTTTTAKPTTQPQPTQTPVPPKAADAQKNEVKCFGGGQKMSHERLSNGARSFCNYVGTVASARQNRGLAGRAAVELKDGFKLEKVETFSGSEEIKFSWEVRGDKCVWTYNLDECMHYLLTPVDSCNCGGINGKQGGYGGNNCLAWMTDPNHSF